MTDHSSPENADTIQSHAAWLADGLEGPGWRDYVGMATTELRRIANAPQPPSPANETTLFEQCARVAEEFCEQGRDGYQIAKAIREIERTVISAQSVPDPCAQFVMWALMEGSWQGCNIDGGAAQDKAVDLGLIVVTEYDPEKHGESDCCDPGDTWYVPSPALLAALGDTSSSSPESQS